MASANAAAEAAKRAASGEYETTLMSEIEKTDAPTLFQVNGPVGLAFL